MQTQTNADIQTETHTGRQTEIGKKASTYTERRAYIDRQTDRQTNVQRQRVLCRGA